MELRNSLASHFALDLPATLTFDYPTAAALSDFIVGSSLSLSKVTEDLTFSTSTTQ